MILLLPLFIGILLYIFKERDTILLSSAFSLFFIYSKSFFFTPELFLSMLFLFLVMIWIHSNPTSLLGVFFLIGGLLALTSTSIFSLLLSIELISFTMIILLNFYLQDQYPGILYYLFSGIISAFFILSLGYLFLGSTIAFKFLHYVLFAKIGVAPFHILLPTIYNNLSPKVILLIDIPYKLILLFIFFKISISSLHIMIYLSILVGSVGSLRYQNLLSLAVYSSLFNYSLLLISISFQNLEFFLYYLFYYSIIIVLYFSLITSKFLDHTFTNYYYLFFWVLLLFNLIGIPPLNGFWMKFFIIQLSLFNSSFFLVFLICLGILLFTFTYLRLLLSILLNTKSKNIESVKEKKIENFLLSNLITILSIPLFF